MKIYDELTRAEITDPDLEAGYLYSGEIVTGQTEEHTEVMEGTVTEERPDGLRRLVPAQEITEPCQWYRTYTPEDKQSALNDKLAELSAACEDAISRGTKVRFSNGSERMVTYDIKDQTNIKELFDAVRMGAPAYLFHTPSGDCMMYSAADIIAMYSTLAGYKTSQLTYHNKLKAYVESLDTVPAIKSVQYGTPLTGEYLEGYDKLIAEAEAVMQALLLKVVPQGGG